MVDSVNDLFMKSRNANRKVRDKKLVEDRDKALFLLGKFCFFHLLTVSSCKTLEDVINLFLEKTGVYLIGDIFSENPRNPSSLSFEYESSNIKEIYMSTLEGLVARHIPKIIINIGSLNEHSIALLNSQKDFHIFPKSTFRKYIDSITLLLASRSISSYPVIQSLLSTEALVFFEEQLPLLEDLTPVNEARYSVNREEFYTLMHERVLNNAINFEERCSNYINMEGLKDRQPPWTINTLPYTNTFLPETFPHPKKLSISTSVFRKTLELRGNEMLTTILRWLKRYFTDLLYKTLSEENMMFHPNHYPYNKPISFLDWETNEIKEKTIVYEISKLKNPHRNKMMIAYYSTYPSRITIRDVPKGFEKMEEGEREYILLEEFLREQWEIYRKYTIKNAEEILEILDKLLEKRESSHDSETRLRSTYVL